ncbi:MAG: hypothetical protein Ta2F_15810 [Termitinemataceae bacterium]|nr:MAG: hypothetical protein Ta2F_15810 [Termitinemataceae bacterium]
MSNKKRLRLPFVLLIVCFLFSGAYIFGAPKPKPPPKPKGKPAATKEVPEAEANASANGAASTGTTSTDSIKNRTWLLSQIKVGEGDITLNRTQMASNNKGDYYILQFTSEGISGIAAPNRYFAPFATSEGNFFKLQPIVGTMMANNMNIGGLAENEYYWYLQRAVRWQLSGNSLQLFVQDPQKPDEIIMIFQAQ